jgi:hypothetical protein
VALNPFWPQAGFDQTDFNLENSTPWHARSLRPPSPPGRLTRILALVLHATVRGRSHAAHWHPRLSPSWPVALLLLAPAPAFLMPLATSTPSASPRLSSLPKMEDRKRPAVSAADDVAPPAKRQATINGSKSALDADSDLKEDTFIEVSGTRPPLRPRPALVVSSTTPSPILQSRSLLTGHCSGAGIYNFAQQCRPEIVLTPPALRLPPRLPTFHPPTRAIHLRVISGHLVMSLLALFSLSYISGAFVSVETWLTVGNCRNTKKGPFIGRCKTTSGERKHSKNN